MYPYQSPWPYPMPQSSNKKEMKRLFRILERQLKPKKEDKKKDEKKPEGRFKSPFTVVQWLVILCTFGPLMVPWYIAGIVSSWQTATFMIKAALP